MIEKSNNSAPFGSTLLAALLMSATDASETLADFLGETPEALYGKEIWLEKTELGENEDSGGLSLRSEKDIRSKRPEGVTKDQARKSLGSWAREHEASFIGDGAFGDSVGPWSTSWRIWDWEKEVLQMPWGTETKWRRILEDVVEIIGYQAPDGRSRCKNRNEVGALCDRVLDSRGDCRECGYSTIWEEEYKSFQEHCQGLNVLDRQMVCALNKAYKTERFARLSAVRRWFAGAPAEKIGLGRARFYKHVVASRKLAAQTGYWFQQYLTKEEVDSVFAVIEYRQNGGEPIGKGKPEATEKNIVPEVRKVGIFSKGLTTEQAQWTLSQRPALIEIHDLPKEDFLSCVAKVQKAWE